MGRFTRTHRLPRWRRILRSIPKNLGPLRLATFLYRLLQTISGERPSQEQPTLTGRILGAFLALRSERSGGNVAIYIDNSNSRDALAKGYTDANVIDLIVNFLGPNSTIRN